MARERGQYKAGDRVSFRISSDVDKETLDYINSLENFSEVVFTFLRDAARESTMKKLIREHEEKYHNDGG